MNKRLPSIFAARVFGLTIKWLGRFLFFYHEQHTDMGFFIMLGFLLTLCGGLILDDKAGEARVCVSLVLLITGLVFSVYALEDKHKEGMRDASRLCQFEECPYEYEVRSRTQRDTVLAQE